MKKRIILITLIGISFGINAQDQTINGATFKTNGNVGIGTTTPHRSLTFPYNSTGIGFEYSSTNSNVGHSIAKNINNSLLFKVDYSTWPSSAPLFEFQGQGENVAMMILNNGNVGIGTTSPLGKLHIETNKWSESLLTLKDSHYSPHQVYNFQIESDGLKIKHDNIINYQFKSGGNFIVNNGKVGIGTTTPDSKLSVNGNIHTKEVKVDLIGWSDFVFEKEYNLPTLAEVENHIKEKGHLKDIPSAKEVKKNGIYLGEMNSKLLQKIEELTLYTIQQEKRLNNIEFKNKKLEKENKSLTSINSKLIEILKRLEKLENK